MTMFLVIITITCIAAVILDHVSGMDRKPTSRPRKPKKKNFFVRMGEGDVTYPGYTVHND